MKNPAWIVLLALLAVSCRKEPAAAEAPVASPTPATVETAPIRVGAASAPMAAADEPPQENARTRPLPRPEDPKHKPAPPLETPMPTAVAVKGSPGFIMSPYNDKIIDVRDIPPGTLVADPNYPPEERKYFRVP